MINRLTSICANLRCKPILLKGVQRQPIICLKHSTRGSVTAAKPAIVIKTIGELEVTDLVEEKLMTNAHVLVLAICRQDANDARKDPH